MYLDCGGDYGKASRGLGVHRSTVRYRVQRIRELTSLDLYDADIWLSLHGATRARARLSACS
ncbi:MAG: helix-turn-helix domain-containing protein [Pseudonocardiales bacterium]|nr:helix-turn-helix domain-containing protein [Pseudonocardiales bacterium]